MAYDPEFPIPAKEWLALSRTQRRDLVAEYLHRVKPDYPRIRSYAAVVAAVETQLAIGLPAVREAILRERYEGSSRWGALGLVCWLFLEHMEETRPSESTREIYRRYCRYLIGSRARTASDDFGLPPT